MGMVKVPSMEHYWSPRLLDSQVVKNIMSRGRFNAIKAMLLLESVEAQTPAPDNNRHREVGVWLDMFNEQNKQLRKHTGLLNNYKAARPLTNNQSYVRVR